ncbi:hypothetical protein BCR35DRAFT_304921 [Leucosporidium creatinivorum]|uniref:SMP-LTD domain-containing protein n=1 Tax=Leucosporidium creatinivorum TaxID=106004 RepID=A0A1Y2F4V8_9BASI|nr:hypothetical protein BCR35DRAFT_304921 [Leucosporidium creatinivorum]
MFSALALFVSFVVGGCTLIPLLVAAFLGFLFYTSPVVHLPRKTGIPPLNATNEDEAQPFTLYRAGWLTVRRTYEPLLESNGTYVGMMVSGYRSFMDNRSRDPRRSKPKDQFYGVLKQNILFLYDNEEQVDCWAAVEVSQHEVIIYPEGNLDGELFVKRNAITLKPKSVEGDAALAAHAATEETTHDMEPNKPLPWFIFAKVNSDKEDWYHSLVQASKLGTSNTTATLEKDRSLFDPEDMATLVDGIDAQPDSIPMRWFNALLGRIFLAVYRTSTLEEYITSRIVRKLKRVKTPSILSEIQVREVNVGTAIPFFSKPMLKELTAEGDASMETHVSYVGDIRITIETVATINLGSRFKPYSVRLVLAVVLKEIEGNLLLKIKKPPSNRVWFGFSSMPRMVLNVEPVVSTRQIKWSMITSPIESRIREVIMESIVVPHMDDLSFFNTRPFSSRGGIWGDALRKEHDLHTPAGGSGDEATAIGTSETPEVDEVTGEPVPSVAGQEGIESTTSAKEAATSTARARNRRRTSSEGERGRPEGSAAPIKSASSSSSLSSFSLSSWRESRASAATASTSPPTTGAGAGDKRRSWFGGGRSPSQGPATPPANGSLASLGRTNTNDSTSSVDSTSTKTGVEDSAARLRDILSKRAQSREREKETRVGGAAESIKEDDQAEAAETDESTSKPSGLSLTAPKSTTPSSTPSPVSLLAPSPIPLRASDSELSIVSQMPLTESPIASLVGTPELSTSPLPSLPTSQSTPSLSTKAERPPSPTPSATSTIASTSSLAPPPVPSRPSFTKTLPSTPPPPPRRGPTHQTTLSADSATPATSSILSSWRAKAADKEALAAGVAQAKDTMKRWGATWNARKTGAGKETAVVEDAQDDIGASSPPQDGGRSLSSSREREVEGSPTRKDEYRDYRAGKRSNGNGDYFPTDPSTSSSTAPISMPDEPSAARTRDFSTAVSTSPPRTSTTRTHRASLSSSPSAGHFTPAAPSPTTKLSTAPTFATGTPSPSASTSPSKSSTATTTPARAYKPATMMAIPGIRDESRRNAVASDHVSAEESEGRDAVAGDGEKGEKVESKSGKGLKEGAKAEKKKREVPAAPTMTEVQEAEFVAKPPSDVVSTSPPAPIVTDQHPSFPPPPPPRPPAPVQVELPTPSAASATIPRPVPLPPAAMEPALVSLASQDVVSTTHATPPAPPTLPPRSIAETIPTSIIAEPPASTEALSEEAAAKDMSSVGNLVDHTANDSALATGTDVADEDADEDGWGLDGPLDEEEEGGKESVPA